MPGINQHRPCKEDIGLTLPNWRRIAVAWGMRLFPRFFIKMSTEIHRLVSHVGLTKKLLNNRVGAEEFQTAAHIQKRGKFSVSKDDSERINIMQRVPNEMPSWNQVIYKKAEHISETVHKAVETSMQPSGHVLSVLSDIRKPLSGGKLFQIVKRTSIRASFSWMPERSLQHIFC